MYIVHVYNSYINQTGMYGHHASLGYVTVLLDGFLLMHGYYIRYC